MAAALAPRPIGIDLEDPSRRRRYLAIARHYFHPSEISALERVGLSEQQRRFLLQWTAREAYLKALGKGIAGGLKRLCIEFDAQDQPAVALCDGGQDWRFGYWCSDTLTACAAWQAETLTWEWWDWQHGAAPLSPLWQQQAGEDRRSDS